MFSTPSLCTLLQHRRIFQFTGVSIHAYLIHYVHTSNNSPPVQTSNKKRGFLGNPRRTCFALLVSFAGVAVTLINVFTCLFFVPPHFVFSLSCSFSSRTSCFLRSSSLPRRRLRFLLSSFFSVSSFSSLCLFRL